jgi:hypothetical protein
MSKLNGHHDFGGGHGEELVSYIYGELDPPRRDAFESHLSGCDECAVELASFSEARLGVIEWRREDFEHLATPEIGIPYETVTSTELVPGRNGLFADVLTAIRGLSALSKIGVAFAAACLAVGIAYFAAFTPKQNVEVASKASPNVNLATISRPEIVEPIPEQSIPNKSEELAAKPFLNERRQAEPQRSLPIHQSTIRPRRLSTAPKAETAKAPRLNSFDDEDDRSLRLSDLFAELGSGGGE